MSERLAVCEALAAMIRQHGAPSEEEITFVGMAALQLGLEAEENEKVQATLRQGGDFQSLLRKVTSRPMRAFLMRRILAASLLDEQISDAEQSVIEQAAAAFGLSAQTVATLIAWMRVNIEAERQLTQLLAAV